MPAIATTNRPILLARGVLNPATGSGEQSKPGSGSTITIYDSTANSNGLQFGTPVPFTRLMLTIVSSADSNATGVIFEGSEDNGANWDNMATPAQYLTANGMMTFDTGVTAPQVRVRYINSSAVLTTWRMSLTAVNGDRAKLT